MKSKFVKIRNSLIFSSRFPFIYTSCALLAQLATAWSTRDTCTVCGHPTMSNYFTMYKIVAVLAFAYCSGYHCYYLSDYKLGVHMYCLWPPHYYKLGVHMYCLWPPLHLLLVCTTLGVHCTVPVIVLLEFQYYKHKLYSWGHGMTPTLFLIVLLEFQYYTQKPFHRMYNPGGTPLQEEPF